jgi:hypothetical protein
VKRPVYTIGVCVLALVGGWLARGAFNHPAAAPHASVEHERNGPGRAEKELEQRMADMQRRLAALEGKRGPSANPAPGSSARRPPGVESTLEGHEAAFAKAPAPTPWATRKRAELTTYLDRTKNARKLALACRGDWCRLETEHATAEKADAFLVHLSLEPEFSGMRFLQAQAGANPRRRVLFIHPADH